MVTFIRQFYHQTLNLCILIFNILNLSDHFYLSESLSPSSFFFFFFLQERKWYHLVDWIHITGWRAWNLHPDHQTITWRKPAVWSQSSEPLQHKPDIQQITLPKSYWWAFMLARLATAWALWIHVVFESSVICLQCQLKVQLLKSCHIKKSSWRISHWCSFVKLKLGIMCPTNGCWTTSSSSRKMRRIPLNSSWYAG